MEGFDVDLRNQVAATYRDGRWICVMPTAASAEQFMAQVAEAADLAVPSSEQERRSSPLIGLAVHDTESDPSTGFPVLSLDRPSSGDFVTDVLATGAAVAAITPAIQNSLDSWDPDGMARVLIPSLMQDDPVAGRSVFGGRPAAWAALEDKLAVLDLWADAGIATAPAEIVTLENETIPIAAHRRLAGPDGSVWAVDNSEGLHGGAAGTFWVQSEESARETASRLAGSHDRVRIMPFLNGVPCSIHGIVLDEATVPTRPNEMIVYVDRSDHRFHYCRFANHWDPTPDDRAAMIDAATAVGDALRAAVGFRGVFSLDGVLTANGFRPTEVNPRYGVALPFQLPTSDGSALNLVLLDKAVIAGPSSTRRRAAPNLVDSPTRRSPPRRRLVSHGRDGG